MGAASSIVASSSARAFAVVVEASRRSARAALRYHYRTRFKACGANVRFDPASSRIDYEHVRVGSNVFLGAGAVIGRADIGDDVMFGPNVHIRDGNHRYNVLGKTIQDSGDGEPGLVVIASDVWIGDGTTVIRGGSVGEGSVVGTRSLVTKSDPCLCNRRRYAMPRSQTAVRRRRVARAPTAPRPPSRRGRANADRARSGAQRTGG